MATSADELGLSEMLADKAPKFNFVRAFHHPVNSPREAHYMALLMVGALAYLFLVHKGFRPLIVRG